MLKLRFICVLLIVTVLVGCTRSLADEPRFRDPSFHLQKTGSSARSLLTDSVFKSLKIEVQYMKEAKPSDESLENLKKFLTKHLHKPGGIHIITKEIPAPEDTVYNLQTVMQLEDENRRAFTRQDELAIYVLFADGYHYNQTLLGYAYRNTSVVLFERHLRETASRYKKHSLTYLESRVLLHEFGHLMGLVNVGTTLQNEAHYDEENGKHCSNKNCLMYHLADTEDYPLVLLKEAPPALDKNCVKDLRANGGK